MQVSSAYTVKTVLSRQFEIEKHLGLYSTRQSVQSSYIWTTGENVTDFTASKYSFCLVLCIGKGEHITYIYVILLGRWIIKLCYKIMLIQHFMITCHPPTISEIIIKHGSRRAPLRSGSNLKMEVFKLLDLIHLLDAVAISGYNNQYIIYNCLNGSWLFY